MPERGLTNSEAEDADMARPYTIREEESARRRAAGLRAGPRPKVLRIGGVVLLALVAGFVAWFVLRDDDSGTDPTVGPTASVAGSAPGAGPVAVSPSGLRTLQRALGHPIYWAGPRAGNTYEVTQKRDGTVYVRYLPRGVDVGDARGDFLIIVTYPYPNALQAIRRVENGRGISVPGRGLALVAEGYERSVHLAYPNVDYQIEVYNPSPVVARRVATSGRVRPVG
jgi:hypothetical protein